MKKLNILGTKYELIIKDDDPAFEVCGGYRDAFAKQIVVKNFKSDGDPMETKNLKGVLMQNIRHEIVHAFMYESGLDYNAMDCNGAWAKCEEMIDWIAIQGPKIHEAWKKAGALE